MSTSNKTSITMRHLGVEELDDTIRRLREYRDTTIRRKINSTMGEICKRFTEVASKAFGPAVAFSQTKVGEFSYEITAFSPKGKVLVTFLEFGTGFYTDEDHKYADNVEFNVYPGSWSEEHENTWFEWINAGKDPTKYPYNIRPKRGMLKGMDAARKYVHNMAKRLKE